MNENHSPILSPPRRVPAAAVVSLLFENRLSLAGGFTAGLFTLLFLRFIFTTDQLMTKDHRLSLASGKTVRSVPADNRKISSVFIHEYTFVTERGGPYTGKSYSENHFLPGVDVIVEYIRGKPEFSRIKGTRIKMIEKIDTKWFSAGILSGVLLFFAGMIKGLKKWKFLRYSSITTGRITEVKQTGKMIGDRSEFCYTFRYLVNDRFIEGKAKSFRLIPTYKNPDEKILYLKNHPQKAIPLNVLEEVSVDETGRLCPLPGAGTGGIIFFSGIFILVLWKLAETGL